MQKASRRVMLLVLTASVLYSVGSQAQFARSKEAGAVFVMNNSARRNEIISFTRAADGSIEKAGTFATGGRGSGGVTDPLESQGSLTLSHDRSLLFAVNAGSGDLSVFRVHGSTLVLVDRKLTAGAEPNAVAQHEGLVYVLNVGGSSNVVGFKLYEDGKLQPIPNSIRFLTTNNSEGASLTFSPDGRFLLVSERATNNIDVFPVRPDGTLRCSSGFRDRASRWQQCFHNLFVLCACEWNHFSNRRRSSDTRRCKLLECCHSEWALGLRLERGLVDNRRVLHRRWRRTNPNWRNSRGNKSSR